MFPSFVGAISAITELQDRGLIEDYAIGGAVAQLFWDEAIPTFDLDVLILLPATSSKLTSLQPIYAWAAEHGYPEKHEHIEISQIPVQFLPTFDALTEEAVRNARTVDYGGRGVRVVGPEYLCAIWLTPPADTRRRRERVAKLRESVQMDESLLADLTRRYNLRW